MPNGRFMPSTKTSRPCPPPVCCGSRITTISPAPITARKISPFGATVSHRGRLKFVANRLTRKPWRTVGKNPAGGVSFSGPLPADFVENGAGSFGFWPLVICPGNRAGRKNVQARARMFRTRMAEPFRRSLISLSMMPQADARFHLLSLLKKALAKPAGCFLSQEIFLHLTPIDRHPIDHKKSKLRQVSKETEHAKSLYWSSHSHCHNRRTGCLDRRACSRDTISGDPQDALSCSGNRCALGHGQEPANRRSCRRLLLGRPGRL